MVEFNNTWLIAVYITLGLYLLFKVLFRKDPQQSEYEKLYNKVLNSPKYRVKGQHDSEE